MEALAIALVTALATKAFEKAGEKLGENTTEKATGLIKSLFKQNELVSLNLSAESLIEPVQQGKLIGRLEDRLANQPDIANQLQALIDKLNAASDAKITTEKVSDDSDVKSEIEISSTSTGKSEIITKDISKSRVTSTIKRK